MIRMLFFGNSSPYELVQKNTYSNCDMAFRWCLRGPFHSDVSRMRPNVADEAPAGPRALVPCTSACIDFLSPLDKCVH